MANLKVDVDVGVKGAEDVDKLGASFDDVGQKSSGFGSLATGVLQGVGQAAVGLGIGMVSAGIDAAFSAIGQSVELASDKAEAASKVNVLFGESADIVTAASETAAETVGLSSGKYLEAAGNIGNLVTNFGFAGDEAANMSTDIVGLAADMGSFNNANTEDVVNAIGAAFRGETEPIRQFGVMLDDATVKSKAMELGLYDGVGALDKSAKATATYQLILEQTSKQQGDFARTSDGLANGQKIANAKIEESLTKLGEVIAPLAADVLPLLAEAISNAIDNVYLIADAIGDWVANNQPLIDTISSLVNDGLNLLSQAFDAVLDIAGQVADLLSGPFDVALDTIGAAIGLVGTALDVLFDAISAVGDGFNNLHRAIDPNVAQMQDFEAQFRGLGEAAGLSAEQIDAGWQQVTDATGNGSLVAGTDIAGMVDNLVALNDTSRDTAEGIAQNALTASAAIDDVATVTQATATTSTRSWEEITAGAGAGAKALQQSSRDVAAAMGETEQEIDGVNWQQIGAKPATEIAQGLTEKTHLVLDAADRLVELLENGLTPSEQALRLIGGKYTKAVADGITSEIPGAKDAAMDVAVAAINTIEDAGLKGAEGHRGLEAMGKYYDSLLAGGMTADQARLRLVGAGVASETIDGFESKLPGFTSAGDQAADNVADALDSNPWEHYGASIGEAWIDGLAGKVAAGKLEIARAVTIATRAMAGDSPPKEGPLRQIDRWGENVAQAWVDGFSKTLDRSDVLGRLAPNLGPMVAGGTHDAVLVGSPTVAGSSSAPVQIIVNTGVGDPVAIGRGVVEAIAAYERANGRAWRD